MELSIKQEKFSKALNAVSRIANSRAQLPILNNILLRTDGNRLLVAAMNMEIASSQYIGAKVVKPGSLTVPARLLTDFIASIPKGTINIEVKNDKLKITSEGYSSTINGIAADDFPELPVINEAEAVTYTIATDDFKQAISQTIITTSSDATRPVLTGVYWHSFEGNLFLAGTDGYRLAERRLVETKSEIAAIIPTTSLQEVLRSISDTTKQIDVLFDDSQVCFRIDEAEVTSRLIDGNYPDYRQLIPKNSSTSFVVDKPEFSRITKVAGLFARDSGGGVTVTVNDEKNAISLHSIASELGENTSEMTGKITGEGVVTLNSRYLSEALGVIEGDTVSFSFSGKLSPIVLESTSKNTNYKHIIMPLKS